MHTHTALLCLHLHIQAKLIFIHKNICSFSLYSWKIKCNLINTILMFIYLLWLLSQTVRSDLQHYPITGKSDQCPQIRVWQVRLNQCLGVNCRSDGYNWWCCFLLYTYPFQHYREIKIYYKTQKDGLKDIKHTVLNRGVGLICNYEHQRDAIMGDAFIVHCSSNQVHSYMLMIWINESNPEICLHLPRILCLVQIKEERPGSTTAAAWAWVEYLGAKNFTPSVGVHG